MLSKESKPTIPLILPAQFVLEPISNAPLFQNVLLIALPDSSSEFIATSPDLSPLVMATIRTTSYLLIVIPGTSPYFS